VAFIRLLRKPQANSLNKINRTLENKYVFCDRETTFLNITYMITQFVNTNTCTIKFY